MYLRKSQNKGKIPIFLKFWSQTLRDISESKENKSPETIPFSSIEQRNCMPKED